MISLNLYLQHENDKHNEYSIAAKRDDEGDFRLDLIRLVDGWRQENTSVYLRPDLACQLRDRLNVLFPIAEPEILAPSVPIHEEANETCRKLKEPEPPLLAVGK